VSNRPWEVGRVFLKLGAASYGGPAMIGIMQAEIERKRRWVTRERFVEGLALVNFLPGPLAVQLSIVLGYVRAGWLGGVLGGLGFILPGFAIMLTLTILYSAYGALPALRGVFYGLSPVVIGIFAVAVYRLGRAAIKDRAQIVIAAGCALLLGLTPLDIVSTVLLAAAAGVTVYASRRWGLAAVAAVLAVGVARVWLAPSTGLLLAGAATDTASLAAPGLGRLGVFFFKVGAFTFGNGLPILAFVEDQVVRQFRWLTAQEFIDGLALGQLTPGPIITPLAAFVGYRVAGVAGAAVSAAAIFLPSFVLVLAVLPFFERLRKIGWIGAALKGLSPAVIGMTTVALVQMLPNAVVGVLTALVLVGTVAAMVARGIGPLPLLAAGAVVGVVVSVVPGAR
jgi:chromate transporter